MPHGALRAAGSGPDLSGALEPSVRDLAEHDSEPPAEFDRSRPANSTRISRSTRFGALGETVESTETATEPCLATAGTNAGVSVLWGVATIGARARSRGPRTPREGRPSTTRVSCVPDGTETAPKGDTPRTELRASRRCGSPRVRPARPGRDGRPIRSARPKRFRGRAGPRLRSVRCPRAPP